MINLIIEKLSVSPYKDYELRDGLLCRYTDGRHVWVVPKPMQPQILKSIHEQGHLSDRKIVEIENCDYHMEGIGKAVKKVISNCVSCILVLRKNGLQEGYLHPIHKFKVSLKTTHIDHLGPMPSTAKNYQ